MNSAKIIDEATKIVIFSGEGDTGTFEIFNGKRTVKAVKSRITRERCGGDRWVKLFVSADDPKLHDDTYFEYDLAREEIGVFRTIEDSFIRQ